MRHFYVIANYAKPHTLFCVQEIKEYLTAKGAECVVADRMHTKTDRMAVQQHPVPVSADFAEAEPERL